MIKTSKSKQKPYPGEAFIFIKNKTPGGAYAGLVDVSIETFCSYNHSLFTLANKLA